MALTTTDVHGRDAVRGLRPRFYGATALMVLAYFVLETRLYTLQVLRGEELTTKGETNFVQDIRVPHDRGIIYDRYGRIIVDNRPSLDVQVTPAFLGRSKEAQRTIERLSELVGLPSEEQARVQQAVAKARRLDRYKSILVKRDLEPQQIEAIEAERSVFFLDGVDIVEGRRRTYRYGTTAAHLLGYVNEIDPETLEAQRAQGNPKKYQLGDALGRAGVERVFENELRGEDGIEKTVVDSKGRRQPEAFVEQLLGKQRRVEPVPGHNLYLTIDLDLQQRAEAAFHGKAGAVVALDPRTGALLAVASVPAYDPNRASGSLDKEEKAKLDNDPLRPWLDRVTQGQYAPGSTFKIATALAALRARATSPSEKVFCPGYFRLGNRVWRCHKDSGHGWVNLHDAIKLSCDTYFYTMGARVGINDLAAAARLLGYGARTGIFENANGQSVIEEKVGIVPDEAYHNLVDAKTGGYQRGMVLNTAIGQGSVLVTPLQQAMAYAAVASGGRIFKPQIVDHVETADFRVIRRFLPQAVSWAADPGGALPIDSSPLSNDGLNSVEGLASFVHEEVSGESPTLLRPWKPLLLRLLPLASAEVADVQNGLVAVMEEPGGTGYWHRSKLVSMAGKTGTAQVVRIGRERIKVDDMEYFQRDHAWFVSYAPAENPEIVVAVLNEHSGHGGTEAAPIAVSVIDAYIELQQQRAQAKGTLSASAALPGGKP
jgi:penicillin-binding protein 2